MFFVVQAFSFHVEKKKKKKKLLTRKAFPRNVSVCYTIFTNPLILLFIDNLEHVHFSLTGSTVLRAAVETLLLYLQSEVYSIYHIHILVYGNDNRITNPKGM